MPIISGKKPSLFLNASMNLIISCLSFAIEKRNEKGTDLFTQPLPRRKINLSPFPFVVCPLLFLLDQLSRLAHLDLPEQLGELFDLHQ